MRMYQIWQAVGVYGQPQQMRCPWLSSGGGAAGGAWHIQDGMLRLILEHGHSALMADDEEADVIEAMVQVRDLLNSDHDVWPETHGMTEAEWAEMYAEGDARRAAAEAAGA